MRHCIDQPNQSSLAIVGNSDNVNRTCLMTGMNKITMSDSHFMQPKKINHAHYGRLIDYAQASIFIWV